ncbi:triose-phosphate isomerase [Leptospira idonii]|uniref:Triosephosphate isomerase n=1 Tax=Leptospira idonii TaxID=1193500 RepID=A0A4R9LXB5_9LEPT|nr:triose-phosphate isomerase [Leptospira idonii]TGN18191.1 triose-phosphate isomerase [Leptospira idonii]
MRRKIIAGNWKMNLTLSEANAIASGLKEKLPSKTDAEVMVFPSFIHLPSVSSILGETNIVVGSQNAYPAALTAMTGEIAPAQLREIGITTSLVGHSERRQFLGETNEICNEKIKFLLGQGFRVVYCIGETLAERESGNTFSVLSTQIKQGLKGIESALFSKLIVAYEPVWAIGTGKVATPEQAEEAHAFIRNEIAGLFVGGKEVSESLQILYGGSVKPDNIASLLSKPNIDGGLVGGASQKLDSFLALIK